MHIHSIYLHSYKPNSFLGCPWWHHAGLACCPVTDILPRGWYRLVAVLLARNVTGYTQSFLIIRSPISQEHSQVSLPKSKGNQRTWGSHQKIKAPFLVSILSQIGEDTEAYTEMKRCNLAWKLGQDWMCVKGCFYSRCLFSYDSSYQKHLGRMYSATAYATITWILPSHSWGLFMRLRKAIKKPTIIHGLSKISTRALLSHEDDKCVSNKDCSPLLQFQQFKMNI